MSDFEWSHSILRPLIHLERAFTKSVYVALAKNFKIFEFFSKIKKKIKIFGQISEKIVNGSR